MLRINSLQTPRFSGELKLNIEQLISAGPQRRQEIADALSADQFATAQRLIADLGVDDTVLINLTPKDTTAVITLRACPMHKSFRKSGSEALSTFIQRVAHGAQAYSRRFIEGLKDRSTLLQEPLKEIRVFSKAVSSGGLSIQPSKWPHDSNGGFVSITIGDRSFEFSKEVLKGNTTFRLFDRSGLCANPTILRLTLNNKGLASSCQIPLPTPVEIDNIIDAANKGYLRSDVVQLVIDEAVKLFKALDEKAFLPEDTSDESPAPSPMEQLR